MKCSNNSFGVVLKGGMGLLVNLGFETQTRCIDIWIIISLLYIHVSRAVMEGKHLISLSSKALKYIFSTGTIMSLNIKVPLWEPLVGNRTGSTQFFQESHYFSRYCWKCFLFYKTWDTTYRTSLPQFPLLPLPASFLPRLEVNSLTWTGRFLIETQTSDKEKNNKQVWGILFIPSTSEYWCSVLKTLKKSHLFEWCNIEWAEIKVKLFT